ncbi:MAG: hypothetical protein AB8I08_37990 [Sandaracinaceae bacterium]
MTDPIRTRVALAALAEHHFCGQPVFARLEGRVSLSHLVYLALVHRVPSDAEARVLDDLATAASAGDPRVWPMKAARLGATYGDLFAGLASGPLMFGSARIGPRIAGLAAEALVATREKAEELGAVDAAIEALWLGPEHRLPGFGVPFREEDARLSSLSRQIRASERHDLPHWRLSERVARRVSEARRIAPNIALGMAACLLDAAVPAAAVTAMVAALLQHLTLANAFEEAGGPSPGLRRIDAADVRYVGAPPRAMPTNA